MRRALRLAQRGRGKVSPNPMVGAVVVRGDCIVGEGAHLKVGGPHAEIHALRRAGDEARGADLYVTLEPCSFHGRTPPCTEAVLRAGIKRLYCAMEDPDERVAGRGSPRCGNRASPLTSGFALRRRAASTRLTSNTAPKTCPWSCSSWRKLSTAALRRAAAMRVGSPEIERDATFIVGALGSMLWPWARALCKPTIPF